MPAVYATLTVRYSDGQSSALKAMLPKPAPPPPQYVLVQPKKRPRPDPGDRLVYFAWEATSGAVKIGSSQSPKDRVAELQTGCPFPIILLGFIEGGEQRETQLHERFAQHRRGGEWFAMDILDSVKAILAEEGLPEAQE